MSQLVTRQRGGFSLLELMVAVAILAIGLIGVLQVVSQGLRVSWQSEERTVASELAEQRLAEALLDPELEPGSDSGDFGEEYPVYRWSQTVDETELEGLYRVTVEVSWDSGVKTRAVELETCYGPGVLTTDASSGAADEATGDETGASEAESAGAEAASGSALSSPITTTQGGGGRPGGGLGGGQVGGGAGGGFGGGGGRPGGGAQR